jgi:hypothetical protein
LRISAFRRDLMGKQSDLAPRFRAKYALFARGQGYFSHTSNRIGPNQQSKRCGEPIAFPIRVERRNHGLFSLSRTRKESFLPSGPGGETRSRFCASQTSAGVAPLAGRAVCSRVERAWGSSAVHLGEVCAVPFASGRVAFHGRRAFRGSNLALGFASSAVLVAG